MWLAWANIAHCIVSHCRCVGICYNPRSTYIYICQNILLELLFITSPGIRYVGLDSTVVFHIKHEHTNRLFCEIKINIHRKFFTKDHIMTSYPQQAAQLTTIGQTDRAAASHGWPSTLMAFWRPYQPPCLTHVNRKCTTLQTHFLNRRPDHGKVC